jgi:hypothetical protein
MRWVAWLITAAALTALPSSITAQARKPLPPSKMQYPLEWSFKTPPPRGTVTPD